jgi:predicted transcriptional regulator
MWYGAAMNKHVVHGYVLEEELEKRLTRVSERMEMSTTELVNMAVDFFLERAETPEEELKMLDERSREMDETGLHITNDEMREWLERVARGENVPPPKAHT